MNKKKLEQLKREIAEREAKAGSDSKDRQQKIKVLWGSEKKKLKEQKLTEVLRSVSLTENNDLIDRVGELVELVGLQDREIDYLQQFRSDVETMREHYPNELQNLIGKSYTAKPYELIKTGIIKFPKPTPKEQYEMKRRSWHRGDVGLIEHEFRRWRGQLSKTDPPWLKYLPLPKLMPPMCLDDIFAGDTVNMLRLEELFGMNRNRFGRLPRVKRGRETLYDYRAVLAIMGRLLSEKPSGSKARGRPLGTWLPNSDDRTRVLRGIGARMNSLSLPEQIKAKFLTVIDRHLPDSAKK